MVRSRYEDFPIHPTDPIQPEIFQELNQTVISINQQAGVIPGLGNTAISEGGYNQSGRHEPDIEVATVIQREGVAIIIASNNGEGISTFTIRDDCGTLLHPYLIAGKVDKREYSPQAAPITRESENLGNGELAWLVWILKDRIKSDPFKKHLKPNNIPTPFYKSSSI